MAGNTETFAPAFGRGALVAPTTSSASLTIGVGSPAMTFTNLTGSPVYVRIGYGAQTATTADYVVPGFAQISLSKDRDADTVAHLSSSGTGSLHIIPGVGV